MITTLLLSISAAAAGPDAYTYCEAVVTFGANATVADVDVDSCPLHLHNDLATRAERLPWDLVLEPAIGAGAKRGDITDWRAVINVAVPTAAPTAPLRVPAAASGANPAAAVLSDRFQAPAADRRVRLMRLIIEIPPSGLAVVAGIGSAVLGTSTNNPLERDDIVVYSRTRERRRHKNGKRTGNFDRCTPWLAFDPLGQPAGLVTHPDNACRSLPAVFIEPLLWRWTPPRWDGEPIGVGVPLAQIGIGKFQVADGERFAPFLAGDVLVHDVPFSLELPVAGRPTLVEPPSMEIPLVFPDLLESRLGLEDASQIRCQVHLWAAPGRSTAYALAVRGCPDFFGNVVSDAYANAAVVPPERPTHHLETVVFDFDEVTETWMVMRR